MAHVSDDARPGMRRPVRCWQLAVTSMVLFLGALRLGAVTYQVDWQVQASAGGIRTVPDGHYALVDTLGQPIAGDAEGDSYPVEAGFIPALDWLPGPGGTIRIRMEGFRTPLVRG